MNNLDDKIKEYEELEEEYKKCTDIINDNISKRSGIEQKISELYLSISEDRFRSIIGKYFCVDVGDNYKEFYYVYDYVKDDTCCYSLVRYFTVPYNPYINLNCGIKSFSLEKLNSIEEISEDYYESMLDKFIDGIKEFLLDREGL